MAATKDDWYWAAVRGEPAGDRFIIANGKAEMNRRIVAEVDPTDRQASWNAIQRQGRAVTIEDIFDMMFTVIPTYRVNHNRFVLEAAKIPVFAKFLRNARYDLVNYVSNSAHPDAAIPLEPFDQSVADRLSRVVSNTLGIEDDWS